MAFSGEKAGKWARSRILENATALHLLLGMGLNLVVDWLQKNVYSSLSTLQCDSASHQETESISPPLESGGCLLTCQWNMAGEMVCLRSCTHLLSLVPLPSPWEQSWTGLLGDEILCGAELSHPRLAIPRRPSTQWQTHEQAQLTSSKPIPDQHSYSASP